MTLRFQDPDKWDRLTLVNNEHDEYEYADTGMSHFMCPTEWIKKNFTPLRDYNKPRFSSLFEQMAHERKFAEDEYR